MMANGVFHTGASKSGGSGLPQTSGGGTDWGGLLGIVAGGLAALAGGLSRRHSGGTRSSGSGGVDYLRQAIEHPVQYKPPKNEHFESESWESIIAQNNRVGKAVQYKPNRPWRPGESDEGREVAFLAKKYRQSAPQVGPAQWQPPTAVDHAEPATFSHVVYDNASPQVGGIAAAREALQQKNSDQGHWVVEQPAYQRAFREAAQSIEPLTPSDPMILALSALRQVARSASEMPSAQSVGLPTIGLDKLAQAIQKTLGGGITEANFAAVVGPALVALLITVAKIAARNAPKVIRVSTKVAKSAAKAPFKTAVRVASRLKPGVYHISKRVIGNRKNIWTKGEPGNAQENLIQQAPELLRIFKERIQPQQSQGIDS